MSTCYGNVKNENRVLKGCTMQSIIIVFLFIVSIVAIMFFSRKSLVLGMLVGTIILGISSFSLQIFTNIVIRVVLDAETIYLSLAIGIIPIIGAVLNETGLLDEMIENVKLGRKSFLMISPALLGLLPMPGGALFSAPLVEKGGKELTPESKGSINVWFRHIFLMTYPLAPALIIACELAELSMYDVLPVLFTFFIITTIIGYIALVKNISNENVSKERIVTSKFVKPLLTILLAPIVDFMLRIFCGLRSLATLTGVMSSLIMALIVSNFPRKNMQKIISKAKPWEFFFLIILINIYQKFFVESGVSVVLESVKFNKFMILILASFLMAFALGRVSTGLIIFIPIYVLKFSTISAIELALLYYSTTLGYIISPVHPCLIVTANYFKTDVKEIIKKLAPVDIISLLLGVLMLIPIFM